MLGSRRPKSEPIRSVAGYIARSPVSRVVGRKGDLRAVIFTLAKDEGVPFVAV